MFRVLGSKFIYAQCFEVKILPVRSSPLVTFWRNYYHSSVVNTSDGKAAIQGHARSQYYLPKAITDLNSLGSYIRQPGVDKTSGSFWVLVISHDADFNAGRTAEAALRVEAHFSGRSARKLDELAVAGWLVKCLIDVAGFTARDGR